MSTYHDGTNAIYENTKGGRTLVHGQTTAFMVLRLATPLLYLTPKLPTLKVHFFKAANRAASSSISGIVPFTGPLLSVAFFVAVPSCIFLLGFSSRFPGPFTLGCRFSVLGLGGFTLK